MKLRAICIALMVLMALGCKPSESKLTYTSGSSKEISCVIVIPAGRKIYSSNKRKHLKEVSIDREFKIKLGRLTENKVPVNQIKVARKNQAGFFDFFNEVSSYQSCDETKKYLESIFFKSYGYHPKYLTITSSK